MYSYFIDISLTVIVLNYLFILRHLFWEFLILVSGHFRLFRRRFFPRSISLFRRISLRCDVRFLAGAGAFCRCFRCLACFLFVFRFRFFRRRFDRRRRFFRRTFSFLVFTAWLFRLDRCITISGTTRSRCIFGAIDWK